MFKNLFSRFGKRVGASKSLQMSIVRQQYGVPRLHKKNELHTDASQQWLGSVLYQLQMGKHGVLSFASTGWNK